MKPMKLTDVGIDDSLIAQYINNPDWVMQQKHDGARMLVVYQLGEITFLNGSGELMSFSAAKLLLPALEAELYSWFAQHSVDSAVLDGELIIETGVYHVWDLVLAQRNGLPLVTANSEWWERHQALHGLDDGALVQKTVTASTPFEKGALWAAVNAQAVEGAVSKRRDSRWIAGTRTKEWVKHKIVKAGDVVVTSVQRTFKADGVTLSHGKAELAVPIRPEEDPQPFVNARGKRFAHPGESKAPTRVEPRVLLPVGNASLIGKELTIEVGSVVEVNYLYWTGDAMVQPRIVRQRFDKTAEECTLDQFPTYTRAVVTL